MTRALLLGRFLRGLLSCRFCSCCQQQPGVVPSVQLQAWDGLVLQAHASCGSGGKSLLMGVLKCCETLLHTLPMLKGSQWPVQHGASPGMLDLSRPIQAWPPLSQCQPLLGTPLCHSRGCLLPSPPGTFCVCRVARSCTQRRGVSPTAPSASSGGCGSAPVSSCGINASVTDCQGDVAVLNVSLLASTFSLTP